MTNKHTPGPWIVGAAYGNDSARIETLGGETIGAIKVRQLAAVEKGHAIYAWSDELAANARMVAAAPELLAVAECILADDLLQYLPAEYIARVRAAIAKATGGEA